MIPEELFGKDHWSTLAYIEVRCTDYRGTVQLPQMRYDQNLHPQFHSHKNGDGGKYPTRLKDGSLQYEHDDWSCVEDMEKAGYLKWGGTGLHPVFSLTKKGRSIANQLREHKANGGTFDNFKPKT